MSTPLIPAWEDDTNVESSDGPGRHLRIARQTRGLTQERAAGELHLSPAMIEALEHDDYSALPDDVFVAGYIRKYAHLVDLKPEPLVAAYRAAAPGMAPTRTDTVPRTGFQIDSSHLVMGAAGIGVLILLGTLAFLWYQNRQSDPGMETAAARVVPRTTAPVPMPETIPESRTPASPIDTVPIAVEEVKPSPQPESDIQPPQHAGPATPSASEPQPTAATPAEEVGEGGGEKSAADGVITAADSRSPTTDPDAEETQEVEKTEEPIAAEPGKIEIIFDGPCWVDVRDKQKKYKLSGIKKKGERYVLEGNPPYSFKLGNPAVVRITVGGKPFDLSTVPRSRRGGARFTLNPDQLP